MHLTRNRGQGFYFRKEEKQQIYISLEIAIDRRKKALAPGGFKLGTSRLRGRRSNHFATTTAHLQGHLILSQTAQYLVFIMEMA